MLHTIYAIFDRPADAADARAALEAAGHDGRHFSVVLHARHFDDVAVSELPLFETSALKGGVWGGAIGGLLGALGVVFLGPLGLIGGGALATLLFGTTASTLLGAFTGAIAGATSADPALKELARGIEVGKVLLTVDCPSLTSSEEAEGVLRAHHAELVHRAVFWQTAAVENAVVARLAPHPA